MAKKKSPHQRGPKAPKQLIDAVLDRSVSKTWAEAVKEWYVLSCDEDESCSETCVCGHEGLRYNFSIRNELNGEVIYPIGSKCIEKFENNDMSDDAKCWIAVHRLMRRATRYGRDKTLSLFDDKDVFSRRLIWFLYEQGAFKPTRYNRFEPYNDADFLIDMFNKRDYPTKHQRAKADAIVERQIYPFLRQVYVRDMAARKVVSAARDSRSVTPIETVWHGHRFRSRLEARWAVAFEAMGIDWLYEDQGFVLEDGTQYLPDFKLRGRDGWFYVEVKGRWTAEDAHKVELFSKGRQLLVVEELPYVERRGDVGLMLGSTRSGMAVGVNDDEEAVILTMASHRCYAELTTLSYEAASKCRFEHGEAPETCEEFIEATQIRPSRV